MNKKGIQMLKGLNVINIIFILFISSPSIFCQQKMEGIYHMNEMGDFYQIYTCTANTFSYEAGGDLGMSIYGNGHYSIKNDSIIFNFDLTTLKEESFFKAKKYYNSKDSVEIHINGYTFNKAPIANLMIYSFPNYQSTETNKDGVANLKFKKESNKNKIQLHVNGEFWVKQAIDLDLSANYILDVFMGKSIVQGFGHPKAIKNEIRKYKILKLDDSILKLKNKDQVLVFKKQD